MATWSEKMEKLLERTDPAFQKWWATQRNFLHTDEDKLPECQRERLQDRWPEQVAAEREEEDRMWERYRLRFFILAFSAYALGVAETAGIERRTCALKECDVTFITSSQSRREYCTQAHAHLASVRRCRSTS